MEASGCTIDWSGPSKTAIAGKQGTGVFVCQACGFQGGPYFTLWDTRGGAAEHYVTEHTDKTKYDKPRNAGPRLVCRYDGCTKAGFIKYGGYCKAHYTEVFA